MTLILNTQCRAEAIEFSNAVLEHIRFQEGLIAINQVHKTYHRTPKGMFVVGLPGTGKSRLIQHYQEKFNIRDRSMRDYCPVLIVDVFASNSVDQFYQSILTALGDPEPSKGRIGAKLHRIQKLVEKLEVELIIFDEIHNLLPENVGASSRKIANTIKTLMNQLKVPMILVGEPEAVTLRIDHKSIAGRFPSTHEVKPLSCKGEREIEYFKSYMRGLSSLISLDTVPLDTTEMVFRFMLATRGLPREISEILTKAIELCDSDKVCMIDLVRSHSLLTNNVSVNPFSLNSVKLKKAMEMNC